MTTAASPSGATQRSKNEPIRLDSAWIPERIAKRSCCVLATTSDPGPHAAAVLKRITSHTELALDPLHASGITNVGPFPAPWRSDATGTSLEHVA